MSELYSMFIMPISFALAKLSTLGILAVFVLAGCGTKFAGDDFVGSWKAKGDVAPQGQSVYIADRLIIEKGADGNYNASLLAQGVFTTMEYNKDKGYLCTKKGACFEMKSKDLIRIGSQNGIKEYEREK